MKGKYLRRIAGFILMLVLVPAVGLVSSTTANAQHRGIIVVRPFPRFYGPGWGWYGYPYPYPYYGYNSNYIFGSRESAYDQGYRDGLKTGENDARRHQSYKPERSHYFHNSRYGNYAGEYRRGFDRGYEVGYQS